MTRFSESQLRAMCDACMAAEYQVKSGEMPLEGSLEKVMLQLLRIRREEKDD